MAQRVSVVVPVFNEQGSLDPLYGELVAVAGSRATSWKWCSWTTAPTTIRGRSSGDWRRGTPGCAACASAAISARRPR